MTNTKGKYICTKTFQYAVYIRICPPVSDKSAHGYIAANTLVSYFIFKLFSNYYYLEYLILKMTKMMILQNQYQFIIYC